MKILLSPAKRLDETNSYYDNYKFTTPLLINKSQKLINNLKKYSPEEISSLMNLSYNLGLLNYNRYQKWHIPFNQKNSKPAIFMFMGDAYRGLDVKTLNESEILLLNNKLRILSGLYGILKPLDLIQPYRLEMKTKIKIDKKNNLYEFWGEIITQELNKEIVSDNIKHIINLASNEYFKSIKTNKLKAKIITPVFKEEKNGTYKIVAINAKRARGLMTRFIIKNDITDINNLKAFDYEGYYFNSQMSTNDNFVFIK